MTCLYTLISSIKDSRPIWAGPTLGNPLNLLPLRRHLPHLEVLEIDSQHRCLEEYNSASFLKLESYYIGEASKQCSGGQSGTHPWWWLGAVLSQELNQSCVKCEPLILVCSLLPL